MKNRLTKQLEAIKESILLSDIESFEELKKDCLNSVFNNKAIIASGLGKNVPICEKVVGTLNSFGVLAHFLHTNSAMHGDLGKIKDGDTVFVLSKSGNTAETLDLINHLVDRDIKIWLVTFNRNSIYCNHSKVKIAYLHLEHEDDKWDLVPHNSSIIFLLFLQTLAMEIYDELDIKLHHYHKNHPGGSIGKKSNDMLSK